MMNKTLSTVYISSNSKVELREDGVYLVKFKDKDGEENVTSYVKILTGKFRPMRKLMLDKEIVYEVETVRLFRGNAEEIIQQLKREGIVLNRSKVADCINALLSASDNNIIEGHSTFGVYPNGNGKLELCLQPYTRTQSQQRVARQIARSLKTNATKEDLENWFKVFTFWHEYEVLPVMGLSAISPFAYVLRDNNKLMPYIFHKSPESGLGKTETIYLATTKLSGLKLLSCDAIKSDYRLCDAFDSAGLLIGIEEAESYAWSKFAPALQQFSEQPESELRGTGGLGMRQYLNRACLVFSGNHLPYKRKPLLIRMLIIEFDRTAKPERSKIENKERLAKIERKLKPIIWDLVRAELESIDYDKDELIRRIDEHENGFANLYGQFTDARRYTVWAVIYEGLKIWERLAEKLGVDWKAPSYEEFVRKIISKIETETFRNVEAPAASFINWWKAWKSINKEYDRELQSYVTKGENEIWAEKTIDFDGRLIPGDVVTKAVLTIYEKEMKGKDGVIVTALPDLARGIASLYVLPEKLIYKDWKIGDRTLKGVFIPEDEAEEKVDVFDNNENSPEKLVENNDKNICEPTKNQSNHATTTMKPRPANGCFEEKTKATDKTETKNVKVARLREKEGTSLKNNSAKSDKKAFNDFESNNILEAVKIEQEKRFELILKAISELEEEFDYARFNELKQILPKEYGLRYKSKIDLLSDLDRLKNDGKIYEARHMAYRVVR